jgi:polyhydroxyalkanoate synthesis regulator phasin
VTDVDDLERRIQNLERAFELFRDAIKELFARVDRLTEQVELSSGTQR